MDLVKAVSAYGLIKDLRLSSEDSKLSTILELVGFDQSSSNMLLGAARSISPDENMLVTEFIQMKGFGSAMNLLMQKSDSEDVQRLGKYMLLADMDVSTSVESYQKVLGDLGVDSETATVVRDIVQENAKPGQSVAAFAKTPAFGGMLMALQQGATKPSPIAGIIECPHCEGLIQS